MAEEWEGPAIGIDLGTTYSCVGVWRSIRVEIIENDMGKKKTPSCVAFTDEGRLIGEAAKNQPASNSENTIFNAKRLVGRCFSDDSVQSDLKLSPFKVVDGSNYRLRIAARYRGEQKHFAPEEISSMVLIKMRQVAEDYLGSTVKNAVITVPACFTKVQRQATIDAGVIAGLNNIRLINEPAAAALTYAFNRKVGWAGRKNVLVFGLGGGALNVSLLAIEKGNLRVMATAGDTHLGGEDFDDRMVEHFVQEFQARHGLDVRDSSRALRRLRTSCEKAKRELSLTKEATIDIECLHDGIDFCSIITRADFQSLNDDHFSMCIAVVNKCLADACMDKRCVDDVLLVGGSTRIPRVQQLLTDHFGRDLCKAVNADQAVAYGAALQAAILTRKDDKEVPPLLLQDVTPLPLIFTMNGNQPQFMVLMNAPIPFKVGPKFRGLYKEETLAVGVCEGHAIIGGLTIQTDFNLQAECSPSGHQCLCLKDSDFEGARCLNFNLCIDIDVNGILSVWLQDYNAERKITIPIQGLTREELEKMKLEAEKYNLHEKENREKMKAKNSLEKYVYKVKNAIDDKKFEGTLLKKIEGATEQAFRLLATDHPAEVNEYNEMEKELRCLWKIHEEAQEVERSYSSSDPDCKTNFRTGATRETNFGGSKEVFGHKISPTTTKQAKVGSIKQMMSKTAEKMAIRSCPCSSSSVVEGVISKVQVDTCLEVHASPSSGDGPKAAVSDASNGSDRAEHAGLSPDAGSPPNKEVKIDDSVGGDAGFARPNGGGSNPGEVEQTSASSGQ
ncbi:heat shock 70 kDa protein 18-like [Nymphaea colorata]|uniref:heat shock 70 kDa protein 18-like n=1 Tax=Nymphaea colorata TaxID=210225 RepID=UPI00129E89AB|nr:heat shock 70 kDa protein 18-like [Nymphaea colorata]